MLNKWLHPPNMETITNYLHPQTQQRRLHRCKSLQTNLTYILLLQNPRKTLWEIERTCLTQIPYHPNQHAFRKGHSTDTALSEAVQRIEKAFSNKNYYLAVFLDIEGAFENITNEAIIQGMKSHNIPEHILSWYQHYLHNRTCFSTLGEETIEITNGE